MPNRALSILLVDSEESIHQAVGTYLQEAGHQVEYAGDSTGSGRTRSACAVSGTGSGDADCCYRTVEPAQP